MDIFRSKKRDTEQASLSDVPSNLQKKHRGRVGSVDSLLDVNVTERLSESEESVSESENDDVFKASKKQKMFAKKSIKREKQKEKEHRRNVEKNLLSMDDYLKKQSEFKMWLYEEKVKTASDLSSPKLKALFKQFVRQWNRRKLSSKYYRCSSLPDSPAPLTPRACNFLSEDKTSKPLTLEPTTDDPPVKEPPKSPFVTFGKTPPKVLRSKKLQLFPTSHDVCLISVVPIGSPQLPRPAVQTKTESKTVSEEVSQYHVPSSGSGTEKEQKTSSSTESGPVPYKVSVYPWAVSKDPNVDDSLEVCSTATPPGPKQCKNDETDWPLPPSEEELSSTFGTRINDSPQVPPPPPPRSESLLSHSGVASPVPLADNYADPYDKLPEKRSESRLVSDYQEPLDCMRSVNTRTIPDNPGLVLKTFSAHNDEPDLSMYQKPIQEKRLSKEELEELYAKPMKRQKKSESEKSSVEASNGNKTSTDLYSEIMDHLSKKKDDSKADKCYQSIDPDYETIDECLAKVNKPSEDKRAYSPDKKASKPVVRQKPVDVKKKPTGESSNLAGRKTAVLAASSDKIYETYLSLGRNVNPFKSKTGGMNQLKQGDLKSKCCSQPDIAVSDGLKVYDSIDIKVGINTPDYVTGSPVLTSFKPVDTRFDGASFGKRGNQFSLLSQRAKSFEDGLKDIDMPGTPTIMATPSFDSLCAVTPLSKKSGSSQSLPTHCNSTDSFLHSDSSLSTSTTSSFSCPTGDHSGSLQSLHSEHSLPPVPEEDESTPKVNLGSQEINKITPENLKVEGKRTEPVSQPDPFIMTPGKRNAGIDLSVYLLKPANQQDGSLQGSSSARGDKSRELAVSTKPDTQENQSRGAHDSQLRSKLFDNQSKLAIKDTLSGVKTKVDQSQNLPKMDAERRHTVQTVHEIKTTPGPKKGIMPISVPNIGVAVKNKKLETFSVKQSMEKEKTLEGVSDREIKQKYGIGTRIVGEGEEQYLETDLDMVEEKTRQPMKKSKSHSGFDSSSSTVVTEIW